VPHASQFERDMKKIAVLGSTGSIGLNALEVIRAHKLHFDVKALAAKTNADLLFEQAKEFRPEAVCLYEKANALELEKKLKKIGVRLVTGDEGLRELSTLASVDQVLFAMVGAVGLVSILEALKAGKDVAVANKEPLVIAGELLMREAKKQKVSLIPVDSEHSGVWQCLEGRPSPSVRKLILTSSGGPFRNRKGSLAGVKPSEALKHPKWKMGPKITIDSATLMNKGLEVIEAVNLFGMPPEKVEVLIHPEAIVHAMVEFLDGSYLAHLGITDMRLPIQFALTYPERLDSLPQLDFRKISAFHFDFPDRKRFPCLDLGYEAVRRGGSMPAALNAANEVAVEAFLKNKIKFTEIPKTIEKVMSRHKVVSSSTLKDLLETDRWAREQAVEEISKF
jgi:1-deoxy-D-xylulose-5-phosphate reductoisomerase